MKRKGFTLVELLAVIVILAVIALIGTPIILNVIEGSQKGAFKASARGVIESAELYKVLNTEDFKNKEEIIFECNGTSCKNENGYSLDIKGEIPKTGRVIVAKDNISVDLLSNGKYCALGTKEKLDIQKDCEKLDITEAIIDNTKLTITSTTNKVIVNIAEDFAIDKESGIKEYKIILIDGETTEEKKISNIGKVEFTELTNNKEYKVKVVVINGNDMEISTAEKEITTKNIDAPTCSVTPTGWSTSKTVTCTYESGYTNEYSIDGGSTWETYTSAVTFTSNGTLIARVNDGTNYISSSSYTVSGIDTTEPTEASFTYTKTSKSITVTASGTDSESGIIRYQFSNDDGSNWTSVQESNIYTFNDLTSGTYKIKVRVYNGTYVNVTSGNFKDSDSQDVKTTTIATPTCSVSPTGWTTSKSVTCTYDSGYTNEYSIDGGSTWKTYTSAVTFTSNGTLIARVNDGKNYVSSSSYTVSQIDTTAPSLTLGTASATSKSVTVPITASDGESNIKSTTCVYGTSTSYGSTGTISGNNCVMSNLEHGKTYYYKVVTTNNAGTSTTKTGSKATTTISTPTCSTSPTGWAQSKTVTCTYPSGYTNQYSTDGGSTWKTYTSAVTFTSNGTLIARVNDGKNYISSSTYTVSQIDTTAPSVSVTLRKGSTSGDVYTSGSWTNQSVYFVLTGSDSESGIDHYEFSHDGSSWSRGHESWSYSANSNKTTATFAITWDGSWDFYFRAVNAAGKASSSTSKVTLRRDTTAPSLTLGTASATSKSITVPITVSDAQSNIKSTTCVYGTSTSYGSTGTISGNNCVMSNLLHGKTYYYKVVTTNNAGTSTTKTGSKATTTIATPTCSTSPSGWTTSKTVTCTYPSGYTNQYSTDGGSTWKTYTSAVTFTSNGTLIARVNDGKNYISSSTYTVSQIDTTAPTVTIKNTIGNFSTSNTDIIILNYALSDSQSGIASYDVYCGYSYNGGFVQDSSLKRAYMDSTRAIFTDSLENYNYCKVSATDKVGKTSYSTVWVDTTSTYNNYLYIKFKGSSKEHLFLSNTNMGVMEHYSDDDSRRYINIPSLYKPDSTYTTGDHYTLTSGSNAWSKTTTSGNINSYFYDLTGTNAKLENIGNWFDKVYCNYSVPTYKNNTAGVISTYNTSFFTSQC